MELVAWSQNLTVERAAEFGARLVLGYVTEETYRIFYSQALEDIQAYARGQPIRTLPPTG
jgi:hypothetical protein